MNDGSCKAAINFEQLISDFRITHCDEDVRLHAWDLCCHQVSVLLTGEITCVQQLHTHTPCAISSCGHAVLSKLTHSQKQSAYLRWSLRRDNSFGTHQHIFSAV